jgi:hypothetical protein
MNNKCLFSEGAYEQNYIEHGCDNVYSLYKYDKCKTIKQMKRDLFFEFQSDYFDKKQLLEMYTRCKNYDYLKKENNYLHKLYFNNYNKKLSKILEDLGLVIWIKKPPTCFDVNIKCCTYSWKDGNEFCLIAVADNKNYVIHWNGS